MSNEFASAGLTAGQLNAIVKKLGGEDMALRFLRGEIVVTEPSRRFREQDGIIYFTLPPTGGTTGLQWIERLEKKGFRISKWARDILSSGDFKPTTGVVNNVAVLKGETFFDQDRITKKIRVEADKRKLGKPNAELACQIREMFTDEEIEAMGLWYIVAMHEPINDSDSDPSLLRACRDDGGLWLRACCGDPDFGWLRGSGFAFVVPQVSPQN